MMLAIIPARGGSRGLTRKNLRPLCGQPLIQYTIDAARQTAAIDLSVVSTDDPEIAEIAGRQGVMVVDRPTDLASDTARSEAVVAHVLGLLREAGKLPDAFVLLQPTSPLRDSPILSLALTEYRETGASCMVSVCEVDHHPFKMFRERDGALEPLFNVEQLSTPRQQLPKVYRQNGAIYLMQTKLFLDHRSLFVPPVRPFLMDEAHSVDVDTLHDLQRCEQLLRRKAP